jgi:hypothetical protein
MQYAIATLTKNCNTANDKLLLDILHTLKNINTQSKNMWLQNLERMNDVIPLQDIINYNTTAERNNIMTCNVFTGNVFACDIITDNVVTYDNWYNACTIMYCKLNIYEKSQLLSYFLPQELLYSRSDTFRDSNGNQKSKFYEYINKYSSEHNEHMNTIFLHQRILDRDGVVINKIKNQCLVETIASALKSNTPDPRVISEVIKVVYGLDNIRDKSILEQIFIFEELDVAFVDNVHDILSVDTIGDFSPQLYLGQDRHCDCEA